MKICASVENHLLVMKMNLMAVFTLALLQLLFVTAYSQLCYRRVSRIQTSSVYRVIYHRVTYRDPNNNLKMLTRMVTGAASMPITRTIYVTEVECCSGYITVNNDCIPFCDTSCTNGTICTAPNVCACAPGWTGQYCETDINECETPGTCDHLCTNTNGSFLCSCQNGYSLDADGTTCNDMNECQLSNNSCDQNCHNTAGSYHCSCNPGTTLNANGYQCDDVDECGLHGVNNCSEGCVNTYGSFNCTCNPGFELDGDGQTCLDIDECVRRNHRCEQLCINNIGAYECACYNNHTLLSNLQNCLGHPENVSLSAINSRSLLLSWDPPVSDARDGSPVYYHVQCTSQQHTAYLYTDSLPPAAHRQLQIENLRPFTEYWCCVAVETSGGTSPMKCLHHITLEAAPSDPPEILLINSSSPFSLMVYTSPPLAPNGVITYYNFYTTFENGTLVTISKTSGILSLQGLLPYELIAVQVSANTSAGESPKSATNFTRTEEDVPAVVTDVSVEVTSHRSISVRWNPPARANGILTTYTIRVYSNTTSIDNTTVVLTRPHHPRSVIVNYLIPYVPYNVEITAFTRVGKGPIWKQTIYTQDGAPNISSLALRTANNSAVILWNIDISAELSGLVLASLSVAYTPAQGQSCPSEFGKHTPSHSTSAQRQSRNISILGLTSTEEYCTSVTLVTITGGIAHSPVHKLSLPSSVYIQIGLPLTGSDCNTFTEEMSTAIVAHTSSALLQAVLISCNCSYSIHHIYQALILCEESRPDLVIYQAHLLNTDIIMAEDLVTHIHKWLLNEPEIDVGGQTLRASLHCQVNVDNLGRVEECFSVNPTEGVREKGTSLHITIGGVLGAVVGATFLILLVTCSAILTKQFYLSKEKRILSERNMSITRGENVYANPGFSADEIKPYTMYR